MTLNALATGRLINDPAEKTSAAGKSYVSATLASGEQGGDSVLVRLMAFGSAGPVLRALRKGDVLAVQGALTASAWLREGEPVAGLAMFVSEVMPLAELKRRRRAISDARGAPAEPPPSRDQQQADRSHAETRAQWKDDPSGFDSMSSDTPF